MEYVNVDLGRLKVVPVDEVNTKMARKIRRDPYNRSVVVLYVGEKSLVEEVHSYLLYGSSGWLAGVSADLIAPKLLVPFEPGRFYLYALDIREQKLTVRWTYRVFSQEGETIYQYGLSAVPDGLAAKVAQDSCRSIRAAKSLAPGFQGLKSRLEHLSG